MDAYSLFYNQIKGKLFAYLMRMTGDWHLSGDILQESFAKCLDRYGTDTRSPALIFAIARNLLFDHFRRRPRNDALNETHPENAPDPESVCLIRDEYRHVMQALEKLEKEERDILSLVAAGELPYRDIAQLMEISEANVKVRIHRARLKLRKVLSERIPPR